MSIVDETIAELDAERERIWLTMPADVADLGQGILPRGTGPKDQYLTSLIFAEGEARTLADEMFWGLLEIARRGGADLATLQMVVDQIIEYKADFFDFVGLPRACDYIHRYGAAARATESMADFIRLTGSALSYANRLHMWIDFVFPWGLANAFPKKPAPATAGPATATA